MPKTKGKNFEYHGLCFVTGILVLHNCDIRPNAPPEYSASDDPLPSYSASVQQNNSKPVSTDFSVSRGDTSGNRIVGIECRMFFKPSESWEAFIPYGFHGAELRNPLIVERMFILPPEKLKSMESAMTKKP